MNQFSNEVFTGRILFIAKSNHHMHHIVFLDSKTIGKVDNLKLLTKLGELEVFESTTPDQVVERCQGKEIIIVNKVQMTADIMKQLPDLRLICVAATGINNVDLSYAEKNDVQVKNVAGYSTPASSRMVGMRSVT